MNWILQDMCHAVDGARREQANAFIVYKTLVKTMAY
ncbi:hypothetical protein MPC1_5810004 [Methylocella tundrae]|nr:hypothetical protein MPC1_5810004 [Methylocella tundrae]